MDFSISLFWKFCVAIRPSGPVGALNTGSGLPRFASASNFASLSGRLS